MLRNLQPDLPYMHIVIDTTETFPDLLLKGPNFVLLRSYIARNSAKLIVPSLVVEETINHYREHLAKHVKSAKAELSTIEKMMTSDKAIPEVEIDEVECVIEFRSYLEKQIKWLGGEVIGFDKVTVNSLLSRSLERRKPFDGEGRKGFRDALLWETVLHEIIQLQGDGAKVVLISKNSNDFGQNGFLADDLKRDCIAAGICGDAVTLYNGLSIFVEKEIKPQLEKLDAIFRTIQEDGEFHEFNPTDFFLENEPSIRIEINSHLRGRSVLSQVSPVYDTLRLNELETMFRDWEVADVWKVDGERIACGLDFTIPAKIECHETKKGYYPDEDEVFSHEWQEEFVGEAKLKIGMIAILSQSDGSVEDFEISDFDVEFGSEWRR